MKWLWLTLLLPACQLFPPPDATHLYECFGQADCTDGLVCGDAGLCVPPADGG